MADTIETLRQRASQLEDSLRKESQRRCDDTEKLRTLLHIAEDEATSQRQRAELAEQRIGRVRDVLGRDEIAAALDLTSAWDIERKRRDRG